MEPQRRSAPPFESVLCGTDNSPAGIIALRHAGWLAGRGSVELIPARALVTATPAELLERCAGHDLVVLGSEPEAQALVGLIPIPLLLARYCEVGCDVTDRILVAVRDREGAARAAELAGRLALHRSGAVSLVAVPDGGRDLSRALATASRVLLCATGTPPATHGALAAPHVAITDAAVRTQASLLLVATGADGWPAETARDVARHASCSVLTVPMPVPARLAPRRFESTSAYRVAVPV